MENIPNGSVAAYTVGPDGPSEGYRRGAGVRGRGGGGPTWGLFNADLQQLST